MEGVRFITPAINELDEAYVYYEEQLQGLGEELLEDVFKAIKRIKSYPFAWPKFSQQTRRCLLYKFPFGVIYHFDEKKNKIIILAIAHLHRKPGYWKNRT